MNADSAVLARARPLALVADQDDSVRALLLEMFYDLGWDAQPVSQPLAPEELLELRPRLLILELIFADAAETLKFAKALRHMQELAWLQIVITSTDHMLLEHIAQTQAAEGFHILAKPFSYEDMFRCVQSAGPVPTRRAGIEKALGA